MVNFFKTMRSIRKKAKSKLSKLTRKSNKTANPQRSRFRSRTHSLSEQKNPMLIIAEEPTISGVSESVESVKPDSKELKDRCTKPIKSSLKKFICIKPASEYVSKMKTTNTGILKHCTEEEHIARYNNLCDDIGFEDYIDNYKNIYPGISKADFKVYWSNLSQKTKESHTKIAEWILVMQRNKALSSFRKSQKSKRSKTPKRVRSALV